MNISYLITCSNETDTLSRLLNRVYRYKDESDEIVVVQDKKFFEINTPTYEIIMKWCMDDGKPIENLQYKPHSLNNDYSEHKNWGARQCKNEFIFQIDGDELPTEMLLINIKEIVKANPSIEAFWIPRINDFRGVRDEHARQWGWKLSISKNYNRLMVNWPDPQCRLFLNKPGRIKWVGRLHERIHGNTNYVYLPADENLALYHDKTIQKQLETNFRYNKDFTEKENQGFNLPK